MLKKAEKYEICLSIDLRCFNNSVPDMGVKAFFDVLGYIPHRLFNHETYMDQMHTHDGNIDDTRLEPQWISQRAMPGAQMWTRRQLKALIDEVHKYGTKFYQGAEAAWSSWPEYGSINRCEYLYENLNDIFIIYKNGKTSAEGGMGAINPLRRFKDGSLYEDLIIKDVSKFILDYECDGFFAADGFAGLAVPLRNGCYGDDMIEQFTEYTGINIPVGKTPKRADYIWSNYRYEWAVFYSDRWAAFHAKLSSSLKKIGKELTTFTPWQLGPADSLLEYGYDYGKSFRAGVDCIALEIMEEVTSRRFQVSSGWESVGISNAATAKATAEGVKILWTIATCNCPEHWHTLRDQPNIIERECLAIGSARTLTSTGEKVSIVDGILTIFGVDLWNSEWVWLKRRLDEGFSYEVDKILGPMIVWSDKILYSHLKLGKKWPVSPVVSKLKYAGIPISQAVNLKNIRHAGDNSLLLVQPLGLEDEDVVLLADVVKAGAQLYVVGEIDNQKLLDLLGIKKTGEGRGKVSWKYNGKTLAVNDPISGYEESISGYAVTTSKSLIDVDGGDTLLATNIVGKGKCIFSRRVLNYMPPIDLPKTAEEFRSYPAVFEEEGSGAGINSIRKQLESLISIHPDDLDFLIAKAIQQEDPRLPIPDKGQIVAFEEKDGSQVLIVENSANLMYANVNVKLPKEKKVVIEFPEIKPIGPVGYVYFGDPSTKSFDVCVPPDAGIPIKIKYKD